MSDEREKLAKQEISRFDVTIDEFGRIEKTVEYPQTVVINKERLSWMIAQADEQRAKIEELKDHLRWLIANMFDQNDVEMVKKILGEEEL